MEVLVGCIRSSVIKLRARDMSAQRLTSTIMFHPGLTVTILPVGSGPRNTLARHYIESLLNRLKSIRLATPDPSTAEHSAVAQREYRLQLGSSSGVAKAMAVSSSHGQQGKGPKHRVCFKDRVETFAVIRLPCARLLIACLQDSSPYKRSR